MTKSRGGLGRGLAALIPTGPSTNTVSAAFMDGPPGGEQAATQGTARETVIYDKSAQFNGHHTAPAPATQDAAPGGLDRPDPKADQVHSGPLNVPSEHSPAGPPLESRSTHVASSDVDGPRYAEVPTDQIRPNPRNPRTVFDEEAMRELEYSITEFGLLQPVVVREVAGGFELVMGERRWRAAVNAGLTAIPAIVRRTEDAALLRDALLENIHRANLNPLEEAAAYQQLLEEFDVTHDELAARLGRSRPVISNTIRLLKLPVPVQRRVAAGVLSAGHARALLSLEDPGEQEELATRVVAEGLSVRGTEEAVVLMAGRTVRSRRSTPRKPSTPSLEALAVRLSDAFDTRVRVELGRQKGRIVVEFATVDDLERIVDIMAPSARLHRTTDNATTADHRAESDQN